MKLNDQQVDQVFLTGHSEVIHSYLRYLLKASLNDLLPFQLDKWKLLINSSEKRIRFEAIAEAHSIKKHLVKLKEEIQKACLNEKEADVLDACHLWDTK